MAEPKPDAFDLLPDPFDSMPDTGAFAPPDVSRGNVPVNAAMQQPNYNRDWMHAAAMEGPPMLGANVGLALGSMTGPAAPVARPILAGVGGALGRAAALGMEPMFPEYPGTADAGAALRNQFMWDAGLATAGPVLKATAKGVGTGLYKLGLRAPKTLHTKFPGMAKFGAEAGVLHLPQAVKLSNAVAGETEAGLREAAAKGVQMKMADIANDAIEQARKAFAAGGEVLDKAAEDRITRRSYATVYKLLRQRGMEETRLPHPSKVNIGAIRAIRFTPEETHLIKQSAAESPAAQAVYNAARTRGKSAGVLPNYQQKVAAGTRQTLSNVPKYDPLMKAQQNLKGLRLALSGEHNMPSPSFVQMASGGVGLHGGGAPGALIAAEASSPTNLRRLGIFMNNRIVGNTLKYGPVPAFHLGRGIATGLTPPMPPDLLDMVPFSTDTLGGTR